MLPCWSPAQKLTHLERKKYLRRTGTDLLSICVNFVSSFWIFFSPQTGIIFWGRTLKLCQNQKILSFFSNRKQKLLTLFQSAQVERIERIIVFILSLFFFIAALRGSLISFCTKSWIFAYTCWQIDGWKSCSIRDISTWRPLIIPIISTSANFSSLL